MDDDTEGIVLDFTHADEPRKKRKSRAPKPIEQRSQSPKAIRKRIRKGTAELETEIELLYRDRKPIAEWDYEELARGRPRGSNGQFNGPAPRWITPAIRDEAQRRLKAKGFQALGAHLGDAIRVTAEIMLDDSVDLDGKPTTPANVRLSAAQFIQDHVLGRATAKVEIDLGEKTRQMLAGAIILPDGTPQDVLDGTVVDDEDEDTEGE